MSNEFLFIKHLGAGASGVIFAIVGAVTGLTLSLPRWACAIMGIVFGLCVYLGVVKVCNSMFRGEKH